MPLAFETQSHGRIAFGFFNIDCDMLLLEQHFFFADSFCAAIGELAASRGDECFEADWPGYLIADREDVGDLMGAIRGQRFTGFIGETYRRYPFPDREDDFRQKPEGSQTREEFEEMIRPFGQSAEIRLSAPANEGEVVLAGFRFAPGPFRELVQYVWRGGWPRWRDGIRPDYVLAMGTLVEASGHAMFRDPGDVHSD